jgi:hypothetical protein
MGLDKIMAEIRAEPALPVAAADSGMVLQVPDAPRPMPFPPRQAEAVSRGLIPPDMPRLPLSPPSQAEAAGHHDDSIRTGQQIFLTQPGPATTEAPQPQRPPCHDDSDLICVGITTDNPVEAIQRLGALIPRGTKKHYRIELSVDPIDAP